MPDEVIEFFNSANPSSRNMTLGLTQPVIEIGESKKVKRRGL
jgi:hypothetical protein